VTTLVVGGSGSVGRWVVRGLLDRGQSVRVSSRRADPPGLPSDVQAVVADLDQPDTLPAALAGIERIFVYARGPATAAIAQAAGAAGVRHLVLLSSASVLDPGADQDFNALRHQSAEDAVTGSGLDWTLLRPGGFCTNAKLWAGQARAGDVVRLAYPGAQLASIHERDIGEVAAVALTTDDLIGAAPVLTGPQSLTQAQQVQAIGAALGRPLRAEGLSANEARAQLGAIMPELYVRVLLGQLAAADGRPAKISPAVQDITGRAGLTFEQWAQDHRADFLPPAG
jgi:uncharacterized protein YbjT (DUF2867 family)